MRTGNFIASFRPAVKTSPGSPSWSHSGYTRGDRVTTVPLLSGPCSESKVQEGQSSAAASPCQAGELVRLQRNHKPAIPVRLLRSSGCKDRKEIHQSAFVWTLRLGPTEAAQACFEGHHD